MNEVGARGNRRSERRLPLQRQSAAAAPARFAEPPLVSGEACAKSPSQIRSSQFFLKRYTLYKSIPHFPLRQSFCVKIHDLFALTGTRSQKAQQKNRGQHPKTLPLLFPDCGFRRVVFSCRRDLPPSRFRPLESFFAGPFGPPVSSGICAVGPRAPVVPPMPRGLPPSAGFRFGALHAAES